MEAFETKGKVVVFGTFKGEYQLPSFPNEHQAHCHWVSSMIITPGRIMLPLAISIAILLLLLLPKNTTASSPNDDYLQPYGRRPIVLPFPNEYDIIGIGGMTYDVKRDLWTVCTENIREYSIVF